MKLPFSGGSAGGSVRLGAPPESDAPSSEAFKARRDDGSRMEDMESLVLDQDDETLSPAVVVATVALLAVFVVGFLVQIVGLVA